MGTVDSLIMILATILLLFVDWLAFHDYMEPHTVRDWLMLVASALVFLHFGRVTWNKMSRRG